MIGVIYLGCGTDITDSFPHLCGGGIHGYMYETLPAVHFEKLPYLVTPSEYKEKLSAAKIKDLKGKKQPTYKFEETEIEFNPTPYSDVTGVTLIDGWLGRNIANVADGFGEAKNRTIILAETLLEFLRCYKLDKLILHTDEAHFIGTLERMATYEKMQWRMDNGEPLPAGEYLKEIYEIFKTLPVTYKHPTKNKELPEWYYRALCNTLYGISTASRGNANTFASVTSELRQDSYWSAEKPIPEILRLKWIYTLQGRPLVERVINDKTYHQYFVGDHSSGADDIEMLGMANSQVCYGLVLLSEPVPIVESVNDYHTKAVWGPESRNYRYDTIMLLNTTNINKPKACWELNNIGIGNLLLKNNRNELVGYDNSPISIVMRPPRLSYRILEEEELLVNILKSTLHLKGYSVGDNFTPLNLVIGDYTDKFYETSEVKGKSVTKMTDFYSNAKDSVEVYLDSPISTAQKVLLVRGIDLPPRNNMAKLVEDHPRVYIVTWTFDHCIFKYATVVITDKLFSVWAGAYSNKRVVIDKGQ